MFSFLSSTHAAVLVDKFLKLKTVSVFLNSHDLVDIYISIIGTLDFMKDQIKKPKQNQKSSLC